MSIVISGTTGIDAGSLPVNNCGNIEVEGNLNLSGVGARITGDFSNSTYSNRVVFQTSTLNTNTAIEIIPNGTSTASGVNACNSSDINNCSLLQLQASATTNNIISNIRGTGSYLPISIVTGGSERVRIDTAGNVGIGISSPTQQLHVRNASGNCNIIAQYGTGNYGGILASANGTYLTQNGNTVALMDSSNNLLLTSGTGGLGYGTGAGGTVTQLTSKGTAVTLNKPTGQIITSNASLAAGARVGFNVNNSLIGADDNIVVTVENSNYNCFAYTPSTGVAVIYITNATGSLLSEAITITFSIIKGATA